mgnify:CR=1 FL=1
MEFSLIAASSASASAVHNAADLLSKQWGGSLEARKSQLLQKNFCWLFVSASDHNEVIGHVKLAPGVQTNSDVYGTAPSGVLTSVVISESHRGKGVGTQLMHLIELEALKQGFCTLILWTPDAMAFYSRLGYTRCEPRRSLSTLVASIDSISAKSISKLEQLFAKRTALSTTEHIDTEANMRDSMPADANNGGNMVWMQKRIREEVPLQYIPYAALRRSIEGSVRGIVGSERSLDGAVLYLHCSNVYSHSTTSTGTGADVISTTPSTSPSTTANGTTGAGTSASDNTALPWSQQVGPSCGIQAIRFAEHVFNGKNSIVRSVLGGSNTASRAERIANSCTDDTQHYACTPTVCTTTSPSILSTAIERGYTAEGALYNIHHIVDLLMRSNNSSMHGVQGVEAFVQSTSSITAGQLCNLILGHNTTPTTTTYANTTTAANPGYVIFPYDRDSTYSTPTALQGVAAHYALLVGCVVLPVAGESSGSDCDSGGTGNCGGE